MPGHKAFEHTALPRQEHVMKKHGQGGLQGAFKLQLWCLWGRSGGVGKDSSLIS